MKVQTYVGGLLQTNAYLLQGPGGYVLVDAPEGVTEWLKETVGNQGKLAHLLITHAHFDHMLEAAQLRRETGCSVWIHQDSARLLKYPETMLAFSPYSSIEGLDPDHFIDEKKDLEVAGITLQAFLCAGHCPGSICFYHPSSKTLFSGDVLFAGGVGRWDLPDGSFKELKRTIREKLYALPDDTQVLPGHGPATTIGVEKKTNPYIRG